MQPTSPATGLRDSKQLDDQRNNSIGKVRDLIEGANAHIKERVLAYARGRAEIPDDDLGMAQEGQLMLCDDWLGRVARIDSYPSSMTRTDDSRWGTSS